MRVSKIPGDKDFDDRPRIVKLNDVEVKDWLWACTFRNVVVSDNGGAKFGSVYIESLPAITVAKGEIVDSEFPAGSEWREEKPLELPSQIMPRKRYKK